MFETYYPVRTELPEAADRYRDTPLGVEAAWRPCEELVEAAGIEPASVNHPQSGLHA